MIEKIKKLSRLLRDYEQFLNNWTKINLVIETRDNQQWVVIEFYRYVTKDDDKGCPVAYRQNTQREFIFNDSEIDRVIDRYRQKVSRERSKAKKDFHGLIDVLQTDLADMGVQYLEADIPDPDKLREQITTDLKHIISRLTGIAKAY